MGSKGAPARLGSARERKPEIRKFGTQRIKLGGRDRKEMQQADCLAQYGTSLAEERPLSEQATLDRI